MKTFNLIISFFYIISVLSQSSSPIFVNSYDVVAGTSGENTPRYLVFNTDGTKMFVVCGTNDRLLEFTLSTDLKSTIWVLKKLSVSLVVGINNLKNKLIDNIMAKSKDSRKNVKKEAAKTPKEKKAEKRLKKSKKD